MMPLSNSRVFVARWLDSLAGAVASVLFPSGCRICEALLTRADRLPVCDACLKSFRELPGEICERCGQPWTEGGDVDGDESICRECRERGFAFDAARSFGIYDGALADPGAVCARFDPAGAAAPDAAEGARIQPGGPVWEAAGEEAWPPLPAGTPEAGASPAGETSPSF